MTTATRERKRTVRRKATATKWICRDSVGDKTRWMFYFEPRFDDGEWVALVGHSPAGLNPSHPLSPSQVKAWIGRDAMPGEYIPNTAWPKKTEMTGHG